MSGIQQLTDRLRDQLVDRFALTEVGAPFEPLVRSADGTSAGVVRVWTGGPGLTVVDSRLVLPEISVDSSMLHAFTASDCGAPHLVSDLAGLPHGVNFHVDLVPRVDLAAHPVYLDTVYPPLTDARAAAYAVDGVRRVDVPLRLLAFSSPWLVGVTVRPEQVEQVAGTYDTYLDRFAALLAEPPTVGDVDLAARDRVTRRAQFDSASDPVWDFLAGIVGRPSVDRLLAVLHDGQAPDR
jgi:hypothetical protein